MSYVPAKGQIGSTERLRQLTDSPAATIWFVSSRSLYECSVLRHQDGQFTMRLVPAGGGSTISAHIEQYSNVGLHQDYKTNPGYQRLFTLRTRAEQYIKEIP